MKEEDMEATFVIVGGGIAGVSCAELLPHLEPDESVLLISASPLVKTAREIIQVTPMLEEFEIEEKPMESLLVDRPNMKVIADMVVKLDVKEHSLVTAKGIRVRYKKLCIATGGKPKIIAEDNEYVIGIRDTETVQTFQKKLVNAKRVAVVGNGGIATELIYEIENCNVIWVIKDSSISATFFDPGAGEFFKPQLKNNKEKDERVVKRMKYTVGGLSTKIDSALHGSALGPDWAAGSSMKGIDSNSSRNIHVEYNSEVKCIYTALEFSKAKLTTTFLDAGDQVWPVYVQLNNGTIFGCDFVISATGVTPDCEQLLEGNDLNIDEDRALIVDRNMQTSEADVFAAGDVCSPGWNLSKHWFQMRLWTQARHMGCYAAKCMAGSLKNEEVIMDFCFELFTHVTKFFGFKVILLGLFNGQKLEKNYEIYLRLTKDKEYVKLVMQNGRIQGAILIGETDLEETFENLILNQMDLSRYGENILDPDIDIEDYFD